MTYTEYTNITDRTYFFPRVPGQKFMNIPTESAMARVYPGCHASTGQVTSICRVSLRSPPYVGFTEEALTICPKNELYCLAPHLSSTKELSSVCVRDTYEQFGKDWRGACPIFYLAGFLLVTACFHTMMNDTVQYVKGKCQKTNEKDKYKLQK